MTNFKLLGDRLEWAKAEREKRTGFKYSWADLARACKATPAAVSRWKNNLNGIDGEYARPLANWLGVNPVWLESGEGTPDRHLNNSQSNISNVDNEEDLDRRHGYRRELDVELSPVESEVIIPQYDAGGSMGNGLILDGTAGVIKSWRVDHEWLRLNVRSHTGAGNLCIVTGFGPSMRPMFNPGDPLLLDRGVNTFDREDAVYFFRIGNHGYIKTVQRIPQPGGGMIYRAKSKNPDYDPFEIIDGMDFEVFGKILTVWKSEQF